EGDEPEPESPQLDDLLNDVIDASLARLLSVGPPHGTERAMLRAAAHGLDRRPHVAVFRKQIPTRRNEILAADATTLVDSGGTTSKAVAHDLRPDQIAIAAHHRICPAEIRGLGRQQRRANPPEDHPRA